MDSAFGIDHGEVSKARSSLFRAAKKAAPGPRAPSRASQIKGSLSRAAEKDISLKEIGSSAGKGVSGVGRFMQNRPGLTGTALVGGGGAAGYKALSTKKKKS